MTAAVDQGYAVASNYLPLAGGTLSGALTLSNAAQATINFRNTTPAIGAGGLWRWALGIGGAMNLQMNTAAAGDFSTVSPTFTASPTTGFIFSGGTVWVNGANLKISSTTSSWFWLDNPTNSTLRLSAGGADVGGTSIATFVDNGNVTISGSPSVGVATNPVSSRPPARPRFTRRTAVLLPSASL